MKKLKNVKKSYRWKHFKKVCQHKFWVAHYCFKVNLIWQGITHDLSKFSPVEFNESARYYVGTSSPINACKKANGYSEAWQHHKGRNKHHYEYWVDNLDNGGVPICMPFPYAVELICDYMGAGRAYYGKKFTFQKELNWWEEKRKHNLMIHPAIKNFIDYVMVFCSKKNRFVTRGELEAIYTREVILYETRKIDMNNRRKYSFIEKGEK